MGTMTLNKGTWFDMVDHETNRVIGEIVDYEKDDMSNQYWFKCLIHFSFNDEGLNGNHVSMSARDFESFPRLELFDENEGRERVNYFAQQVERQRAPVERAEPSPEQELPQRAYQEPRVFHDRNQTRLSEVAEPTAYTVELGSGNMKTMLRLFEDAPAKIFESINKVIRETGHLLLTYAKANVRQKIVDYKVIYENSHSFLQLEKGAVYTLTYRGNETVAKYVSRDVWVTHLEDKNNIPEMQFKMFHQIDIELLVDFQIQKVENQLSFNFTREMGEINPEWSEHPEFEVYCKNTNSDKIKMDLNWQKAIVYHYIMGGTIPENIDISSFQSQEKENIKELANIRDDQKILSLLEA
jgi:hypothetical protein